jgi:hypothetical protein
MTPKLYAKYFCICVIGFGVGRVYGAVHGIVAAAVALLYTVIQAERT